MAKTLSLAIIKIREFTFSSYKYFIPSLYFQNVHADCKIATKLGRQMVSLLFCFVFVFYNDFGKTSKFCHYLLN